VKLELRAMTNRPEKRDKAVIISSTTPSAKYPCSGSALMLWKGRTAMDGLSGSVGPEVSSEATVDAAELVPMSR
jgi:hypothetical protein